MAVRANVDKLMQIKQLEESFSARFFFEARLIPSGKTHEEKKKEAARCFQFLKKNVEGEDVGAIPWANIDMANSKTKCRSRFTVENCLEEPTDESPKPKVWMDGSVVKMSWVIAGEFAEKLELKSFPFDCQELSVTLCLGVPCVKGKEQVHFQLPHEDESRVILNVFSLQNSWMRPERVFLKFDWTDKDKNWQGHQFPTVKISVYLQRKYGFYLWNVVLPMFLIASMSACSMSIHIDKVADRLSATLTLVLTAVAYKYITAQMVPTIGYNTWLDKYVLACFWFLVVIVLENCVAGRFDEQTEFEWFMLIGIMFIFTNIGFAIWAWILIAQATTRAKEGPGENVCCDGCFAAELSDDMTGDALCEF
ncbi:unnamed protein product [Symbiodinium sp. KB8]|nr:unnamed protein product [Symbiodinium sp. KB8]